MKQYEVTLNFTFSKHDCESDTESVHSDSSATGQKEANLKQKAFQRTDAYYEKHSLIKHIKSNDALSFVENLLCDGDVLSAVWDRKKFAIHMVVDTNQTEKQLEDDLRYTSLEDGEYEACGETGWLIFTRGPNNEMFDSPWDSKDFWEYGLTDYRSNPIEIQLLGERPKVPDCKELFTLTEKAKEVYKELAEAREKGLCFGREDEKKFWLMRKLMKDTRMYPVGVAN